MKLSRSESCMRMILNISHSTQYFTCNVLPWQKRVQAQIISRVHDGKVGAPVHIVQGDPVDSWRVIADITDSAAAINSSKKRHHEKNPQKFWKNAQSSLAWSGQYIPITDKLTVSYFLWIEKKNSFNKGWLKKIKRIFHEGLVGGFNHN